jgi:lipopolysaccharide export system permease protein
VNLLPKSILKEFLKRLSLALGAVILVYYLVIFFDVLDDVLEYRASLSSLFRYLVASFPQALAHTMPLSFLVGTLMLLVGLSWGSEIIAMKAVGIRLRTVLFPVIIVGFIFSIFLIPWNSSVVPASLQKRWVVLNADIKGKKAVRLISFSNVWVKKGNNTCLISFYNEKSKEIRGITCFLIKNDVMKITYIAPKAIWKKEKWIAPKGVAIFWDKEGVKEEPFSNLQFDLGLSPSEIDDRKKPPQQMTYGELKEYIKNMEAQGLKRRDLETEAMGRISLAFSPIVMVLLALPFGIVNPRRGEMLLGIGKGILFGFFYWIAISLFFSLSQKGLLPVIVGCWAPHIIFGYLGFRLFEAVE